MKLTNVNKTSLAPLHAQFPCLHEVAGASYLKHESYSRASNSKRIWFIKFVPCIAATDVQIYVLQVHVYKQSFLRQLCFTNSNKSSCFHFLTLLIYSKQCSNIVVEFTEYASVFIFYWLTSHKLRFQSTSTTLSRPWCYILVTVSKRRILKSISQSCLHWSGKF